MEEKELQKLVENISIESFGKLFRHKASFNSRLRTTGGRYLLRTGNIEINKKYLDQLGEVRINRNYKTRALSLSSSSRKKRIPASRSGI